MWSYFTAALPCRRVACFPGVTSSSRSDRISRFAGRVSRPVSFRFKEGYWGGPERRQFGLIAEEVAEVMPELVQFDREGKPKSVRYEMLTSLLLNELQRQQRELAALREEIAARD